MKRVPCRVYGVIASEVNQAVIFRRGPTNVCQMLIWDMNTDVVIEGQWIKATVDVELCDVTPDGKLLVLAASRHSDLGRPPLWTAITRPPYFTALALWLMDDSRDGFGGYWLSNDELAVNEFRTWIEDLAPPEDLKFVQLKLGPQMHEDMFKRRLIRHGWRFTSASAKPTISEISQLIENTAEEIKGHGDLPHLLRSFDIRLISDARSGSVLEKKFDCGRLRIVVGSGGHDFYAIDRDGTVRRTWKPAEHSLRWIDIDARGRVVYAEDGCLWAWDNFPHGKPEMIADLNHNKFKPVPPPDWALKW